MESKRLPRTIEFNRPAKYKALKRLGAGACGETVLVHDENMDCYFVVKKYNPIFTLTEYPDDFLEMLSRFNHEARILFRLNHPNVVRVYSYYDYKEFHTAYILMEYIDGENIIDFSRRNPSMLDIIFEKVVDGFSHLEGRGILHRDIRPLNILIEGNGNPKIIDFGFGKKLESEHKSIEKSISINWWCEIPPEFSDDVYDFQTEVYFVGKLFEKIITEEGLSGFKYMKIVGGMCERDRGKRYETFSAVKNAIATGQFEDLSFSHQDTGIYRKFADAVCYIISSIDPSARYERDYIQVISALELIYRNSMLEENIPDPSDIASVFIKGPFRYWNKREFKTENLRKFLSMLKYLSPDKRSVVLENLLTRLNSLEKTKPKTDLDEVPF